jgi:hypothetical protein
LLIPRVHEVSRREISVKYQNCRHVYSPTEA